MELAQKVVAENMVVHQFLDMKVHKLMLEPTGLLDRARMLLVLIIINMAPVVAAEAGTAEVVLLK